MLIALLALLGVDLAIIVALVVAVVARRRWLNKQPGAFVGAIRVTAGEVTGVSPKWKRGTGRWVRDVLVWSTAPLMFRTHVIPIDSVADVRDSQAGEVKRLGDHPVVVEMLAGDATIELGAEAASSGDVIGPFSAPGATG